MTNLFMHAGLGHIIGNMLFLWVFGIIVEGKLGWWAFTLAFLGIGVVESAGTQLLFHPQNRSTCSAHRVPSTVCSPCDGLGAQERDSLPRLLPVLSHGFRSFDPLVRRVYIGLSFLEFGLRGFSISGAMSHLVGAILGAGLAVALLKFKLVDCENWDLFAVIEGRQGESKKAAAKRRSMMIRPSSDVTRLPGDKPKPRRKRRGRKARRGP